MSTHSPAQNLRHKDRFWIHIAKLVVIKGVEALTPRILVVCLGCVCCSFHESGRRGLDVDECWDLVQFQNAIHGTEGFEFT